MTTLSAVVVPAILISDKPFAFWLPMITNPNKNPVAYLILKLIILLAKAGSPC